MITTRYTFIQQFILDHCCGIEAPTYCYTFLHSKFDDKEKLCVDQTDFLTMKIYNDEG